MNEHTPLLNPVCVSCICQKQMDRYPADAPRTQIMEYLRRLGALLADLPDHGSGPMLLEQIAGIRREVFGATAATLEPNYTALKQHYNAMMLDVAAEEDLFTRVCASDDPVRIALGYALVGNFIDFGALDTVDETQLHAMLATAEERISSEWDAYRQMMHDLSHSHHLVYLTDNCGEIVMDKLCVEVLQVVYPNLSVTVIVRGAPVLNDATVEDAAQVGLDTLPGVRLLSNGDNIAGTALGRISVEARKALYEADVIIAKGMANYETLQGCGLPIYYAFLCKCRMFADRFGVPLYSGMLVREDTEKS